MDDAAQHAHARTPAPRGQKPRRGEGGYALVALLALLTIMAMAVASAAPNIRRQALREREREAIIRGEEVAEAIERWMRLQPQPGPQSLPRSMEQLLEGANPPGRTQKVRVLRAYAARDTLSSSGEWLLVQPQSRKLGEFQFALQTYLGGKMPPPPRETWKGQLWFRGVGITKLGGDEESTGEDDSTGADVPFVGVASRVRRESIVHYYGIDNPNDWVFTPIYR